MKMNARAFLEGYMHKSAGIANTVKKSVGPAASGAALKGGLVGGVGLGAAAVGSKIKSGMEGLTQKVENRNKLILGDDDNSGIKQDTPAKKPIVGAPPVK